MLRVAVVLCLLVATQARSAFRGLSGTPFIINGDDADEGEWPWQCMVLVGLGDSFTCGCSVLDSTHILTASHCISNPCSSTKISTGHLSDNPGDNNKHQASSCVEHPDYEFDNFGVPRFDVAVVTLEEELVFDDKTQPVQRAPSGAGDMFVGQECYITGWGDASAGGGNMPDTLQEAQIRVLELADCQERYSSTVYQVYDESICIFKLEDDDAHTASCYGDSGGPLVCRESADADFVQAGLTSWGYPPCGVDGSADGLPSVYMATGAPEHYDFIDQFVPQQ